MISIKRALFSNIWYDLLGELLEKRAMVTPRGLSSCELINVHLELTNPRCNILVSPTRKLAYRFMVAEWLWVWFGHDDVATIAPYNPNMAQFSDDGETFNGAYGPKIFERWHELRKMLRTLQDTRQAILPIYRVPKKETKDVPCTLTAQFMIRERKLHTIINMRSSDTWLGLPYDFYTFSMLANIMAGQLEINLGSLYFNLGSSHLYEKDFERAAKILAEDDTSTLDSPKLHGEPPARLDMILMKHDASTKDWLRLVEPWETFARVLRAATNREALAELKES